MSCNYYLFQIGLAGADLYEKCEQAGLDPMVSFGNGLLSKVITGCVEENADSGVLQILYYGFDEGDTVIAYTRAPETIYVGNSLGDGLIKYFEVCGTHVESPDEGFLADLGHVLKTCMEVGRDEDKNPCVDIDYLDSEEWTWVSSDNYGEIEIDPKGEYSNARFIQVLPRYGRNKSDFLEATFWGLDEITEGRNIWIGYRLGISRQ